MNILHAILLVFGAVLLIPGSLIVMALCAAKADANANKALSDFNAAWAHFNKALACAHENADRLVLQIAAPPPLAFINEKLQSHPDLGPLKAQFNADSRKALRLGFCCVAIFLLFYAGFQIIYLFKWLDLFDAYMLTPLAWCLFAVAVIFAGISLAIFFSRQNIALFYEYGLVTIKKRELTQLHRAGQVAHLYTEIQDIGFKICDDITKENPAWWECRLTFKNDRTFVLRSPVFTQLAPLSLLLQNIHPQSTPISSSTAATAPAAA